MRASRLPGDYGRKPGSRIGLIARNANALGVRAWHDRRRGERRAVATGCARCDFYVVARPPRAVELCWVLTARRRLVASAEEGAFEPPGSVAAICRFQLEAGPSASPAKSSMTVRSLPQ